MNMMIMSHYGISVVINVRVYDSQDEFKKGWQNNDLALILLIARLEKQTQFDIHRRGHTAG